MATSWMWVCSCSSLSMSSPHNQALHSGNSRSTCHVWNPNLLVTRQGMPCTTDAQAVPLRSKWYRSGRLLQRMLVRGKFARLRELRLGQSNMAPLSEQSASCSSCSMRSSMTACCNGLRTRLETRLALLFGTEDKAYV